MVRGAVPHAREPRTRFALLALAAFLFVAVRVPFLSVPLERDEGEYAYIAQRALLGEVPYRDAFDQKPPGIFLLYGLAFRLLGPSVEAIHGFMYLWTLASCVALWALMRRAADEWAAAFSVLVFAVLSIEPRMAATAANTEIFMLLPMLASTALLLPALERERLALWLACGALAGAACWIKPVAVWNALFLGLFALVSKGPHRRRLVGLAAGALAVSAPVLLWLAALDALGPFWDAVVLHNRAYVETLPLRAGLHHASLVLAHQAPSLWLCWILAAAGLVWPGALSRRSRWLLGGFTAASALGVASGAYFRPHYFVQLLPALAGLAGLAVARVARPLAARSPWLAWPGLALVAGALVAPPLLTHASLWRASPSEISREIYGVNPFVESRRIADYIRETSEPDDRVYVVGSEPQILFHAERRSATRYIFFYPLTGPFPDALERQRELMREVEEADPLYVVWVDLQSSLAVDGDSERWVLEATVDLIERRYRLEFVAVPPLGSKLRSEQFEFVYGTRARQLLAEAQGSETPIPWIAVFRRAP